MESEKNINEFTNLIKLIMEYYSFSSNKSKYGILGIDSELQEFLEDKTAETKSEKKESPIPEDLGIEIKLAFKSQIKKYQ